MTIKPAAPLVLIFCLVLLAGCGAAKPAETPTAQATATGFPTYVYEVPTPVGEFATATPEVIAAAQQTSLDPKLVERGKGRYDALECGTCHGDQAQGTDKGSALVGTTLSEGEFLTVLRTGGKLGNDHLYSSNKLSDSGAHNLYLYIQSLGQTP